MIWMVSVQRTQFQPVHPEVALSWRKWLAQEDCGENLSTLINVSESNRSIELTFRVDAIDLRKVRHVGQQDCTFQNVVERTSSRLENCSQILHYLMNDRINFL